MSRPPFISVGLRKPDFTIITEYPNTRWTQRCSVYSSIVRCNLSIPFPWFDDVFHVPHSRHTEVRKEDILKVPELTLLSESRDAGVYMVMARNGREFS